MLLSAVFVAQLAAQCAPQIASETLLAVAKTESAFDPLAIHDNTDKRSYEPQDTAEAISIARRLFDARHSFDAGLMQINSRNFAILGVTLESAFDPCKSLNAAATLLSAFSRYNTGSPSRGYKNGYVRRVMTAAAEQNSPGAQPADPHGGSISPEEPQAKPPIADDGLGVEQDHQFAP